MSLGKGIPPQVRRPFTLEVIYPRPMTYGGASITIGIVTMLVAIVVFGMPREPVTLVIAILGGVLLLAGVLLIRKGR